MQRRIYRYYSLSHTRIFLRLSGCFILCFLVCLRMPCVAGAAPEASSFAVSGGRILKNGVEFVIRGVSVSGPGAPTDRKTVGDVDLISRTWGFNLVRVGCSIKARTPNDPNDLDEIVRVFTARGVVVLIDPSDHRGGYYGDTAPSLTQLAAWYGEIATRYRNNPLVWFEAMSAPGEREFKPAPDRWLEAHQHILRTIRDTGATNLVVCEGHGWGADCGESGAYMTPESSSAILTFGPALAQRFSNVVFGIHIDQSWAGGTEKIADFLGRAAQKRLPVFVSEYGYSQWTDVTFAIEAMFAICRPRRIGRCVWHWSAGDSLRLVAPDDQTSRQIDAVDGTRPSNLSWLGDKVWDDNHGINPIHGTALDTSGWKAAAFARPRNQDEHRNQPEDVLRTYLLRDDYWTGGVAQQPGQWFEIDMGAKRTFSRLLIDARMRANEFPRGYELYVSNDGAQWGSPIAKGKCRQSSLRLSFPVQSARYIRIVQTEKDWHNWSIGRIEVYAPFTARQISTAAPAPQRSVQIEPRGWHATTGPTSVYDADAPLKPHDNPYRCASFNQPQKPGLWWQVDLGEPYRFHKIVFTSGLSGTDFARAYEVYVSSDGSEWGKPIASGWGSPLTSASFPTQTARYVRLVQTYYASNWWAICEFRLYGETSRPAR